MRILVTYQSPHGSTREIGERIATHLRDNDLSVDCMPISDIRDLAGYDAVVVGSAIHNQGWLPEAAQFLSTHAEELAARPVWLYSVGMPGALARPLRKMAMREGPKAVAPFDVMIHPKGTRLFSGVASRRQFPPLSRAILRLMGGHFGDFRDWSEIEAWAASICHDLLGKSRSRGTPDNSRRSVEVVDVPEVPTAVVRGHVEQDGIAAFLGQAFDDVTQEVTVQGVQMAGPPFAFYLPVGGRGFEIEAGFPTDHMVVPQGRVAVSRLPGGLVTRILHAGDYAELGAVYAAGQQWLADNGYAPAGPPWESYLDGPEVPHPRTQISFPCTKV